MKKNDNIQSIYVWDRGLRIAHYLFGISFIGLFITGLLISKPIVVHQGEPWNHFSMATARNWHMLFAHLFAIGIIMRLLWFFLGTSPHTRWQGLKLYTLDFYKHAFYMIKKYATLRHVVDPPFYAGHNAVAAMVYVAIYILAVFIMLTGYALKAGIDPNGLTATLVGWINPLLGNEQVTRNWHLAITWLTSALVIFHIIWAIAYHFHVDKSVLPSIFVHGFQKRPKDWQPSKPYLKAKESAT